MRRILLVLMLGLCVCLIASAADISAIRAKADAGDIPAMMDLAKAFESGNGVRKDPFQAFDWFMKAAQAGNAEAQNTVGVYLRTGDGGRKDQVEALKWYRLAAKQGSGDAMYNLGAAYYNGDGIAIDDTESFAWFAVASDFDSKAAAEAVQRGLTELTPARLAEGLLTAAVKLRTGTEIPRKSDAAVQWLRKAIEIKSMNAEVMLAKMYLDGDGLPRDPQQAWSLCEDAAKHNYPLGMSCLGYIAKGNYGVPAADPAQALSWYRKAANCGDAASLFIVGRVYEKGEGTRPDAVTAYAYYALAARGEPQAMEAAKRLEGSLGPKDFKKAQEQGTSLLRKINDNRKNCRW